MSFDISTLAASETTEVPLCNPNTGEPLLNEEKKAVTITVYGPGSKAYAKAITSVENRTMDKFKRRGKSSVTPDEKLLNTAEFLSSCTVSLNNFDYKGGTDAKAIKDMYSDRTMGWLSEQVDKTMGDWSNFMKTSEGS